MNLFRRPRDQHLPLSQEEITMSSATRRIGKLALFLAAASTAGAMGSIGIARSGVVLSPKDETA